MNPQITNLVLMLVITQAAKKIPFEDENVLWGVRGLYILSNVIVFGVYMYTKFQIDKKRDMTVLKYVEPAPLGSTEEPKAVTTTIHAYDQKALKGLFQSQLMGIAMMAVMHLYFKYTNPLLIQSILPVKGAFEGNLVKVHVLGQSASGDLKRPWKAAAGMAGMLGGQGAGEIKTDKKSFEAAERSGRGGAKEE